MGVRSPVTGHRVVVSPSNYSLSQTKRVDFLAQGQLEGAEAHGACTCCRARSSSGAAFFSLRAASRVVLHLRWSSSVAARHDHHPHRAEQQVGAGRRSIMTEVTVPTAARRRAAFIEILWRLHLGSAEASILVAVDGWKVVSGLAGCHRRCADQDAAVKEHGIWG